MTDRAATDRAQLEMHRESAQAFEQWAKHESDRLRQEAAEMLVRASAIDEALSMFFAKRKLKGLGK